MLKMFTCDWDEKCLHQFELIPPAGASRLCSDRNEIGAG